MRLLVVGEFNSGLDIAAKIAYENGAKISIASDVMTALGNLRDGKGCDLILIDAKFDIKFLYDSLVLERINVPILAAGVSNDVSIAVSAIRSGAKEYLPLPPDEKLIVSILESIANNKQPMICKSPQMQKVLEMITRVASSDASILLTGKSGTGKEVIANYIHNISKRAGAPFIRLNCAAIPESLLESELFGHEKGAFTGALTRRIGKFEEANGGTLLLDEISEMDIKLQAKLLRAIQERVIERLGSNEVVKVNIRIIAASNRNLEDEIKKGTFREDLYFRLNIIEIKLPVLKDRKEDILDLGNFFIEKYSTNNHIKIKELTLVAQKVLLEYNWPGNIRELENTIHRAVLMAKDDIIDEKDLLIRSNSSDSEDEMTVAEDLLLETTRRKSFGDHESAANILGISIARLKSKLDSYTKDKV